MARHTAIFSLLAAVLAATATASGRASWKNIVVAGKHRAREETSMASCGGTSLCLLGGRGRAQTPVLDSATLKWTEGPAPPVELHHFQAVTGPDGCAWIIGAWTGPFPGEKAVKEIYRYCAKKAEWEVVGSIDRPRGAGGVVYHAGFFYLVTGNVGGHRIEAETKLWFDRYDPRAKTWKVMPDIPHPRDHVNAVVAGGKLYVAGGRDSGNAFPDFFSLVESKVDVFDFAANKWSTLAADFPRPRAGAPAVLFNGVPLVAGGEGLGRAWAAVDVLSGGRFVPFPEMPRTRHGFGMFACNGVLWVAGGAREQGGGKSETVLDAYFAGAKPKPCNFVLPGTPKPDLKPLPVSPKPEPTVTPATATGTGSKETPTPTPSDGDTPGSPETPNEGEDSIGNAGNGIGPQASEQASESIPDCFPAHAVVHLADGSQKTMDALSIGDRVLVSYPDQFSEVYFFSHQHAEHFSQFVQISTSLDEISLHLSPGHQLYVNGQVREARSVRVGDRLTVAHEQGVAVVTSVARIQSKGLFNPHTLHGDIVVNSVHTSTLTDALHPRVANALLRPFIALYGTFGNHRAVHAVNRGVLRVLDRLYW